MWSNTSLLGRRASKQFDGTDSASSSASTSAGQDSLAAPQTLAQRRRSSVRLSQINTQGTTSSTEPLSAAASLESPGSAPPSSANSLLNLRRRSSIFPEAIPPSSAGHLSNGPRPPVTPVPTNLDQARRSSVILGRIGGGPAATLAEKRGSFQLKNLQSSNRNSVRKSWRAEPSPRSATFIPVGHKDDDNLPSPKSSDPLLSLQQADMRRPSFALAIVQTGEALTKAQPRRRLRRVFIRIALAALVLYLVGRFSSNILPASPRLPSFYPADKYPLDNQLPDAFSAFVQQQRPKPSPAPAPAPQRPQRKTRPQEDEEALQRDVARFRADHLWGPPSDKLATLVIKPEEGVEHESTVIFMHGLSQHNTDMPLHSWIAESFPNARWVYPQAPDKPISARDDEVVPGWFDILDFPYDNAVDEDTVNLYASARLINAIIDMERDELVRTLRRRGGLAALGEDPGPKETVGEFGTLKEREWANKRIVLGGFSQGSVMTLLTGLTAKERLAGLLVFSGFLPMRKKLGILISDLDRTTLPIFWGHGQDDEFLLHEDAELSLDLMRATTPTPSGQGGLGLSNVDFFSYPGLTHTWFPTELDEAAKWMLKVLPEPAAPREVRKE